MTDEGDLPKSLYDALNKGVEIANRQQSPRLRRLLERAKEGHDRLKNDPDFRARFFNLVEMLSENAREQDARIAKLNGDPQSFVVLQDFTHKTNERYVRGRRVEQHEDVRVTYVGGSTLVLKPSQFSEPDESGAVYYWWGWIDPEGWIIRCGVLDRYVRKKWISDFAA